MTRSLSCAAIVFFALPSMLLAQGSLEDLTKPIEGRSMRATSSFRGTLSSKAGEAKRYVYDPKGDFLSVPGDETSNSDNTSVEPGKSHVLLEADGPGVITHLWLTFLGPEPQGWAPDGAANHQEMLLRIYYDGNSRPAVEAPVGDFFASCFGKRSEVNSVPVVVEGGGSYNCYWKMPFRKSIKIEIVNESEKQLRLLYYNIDWIKKDKMSEDTPYFYAQYRQEYPVEPGKDYVILDTKGKGHYVGTVLAVRARSPEWFGEGDERIYIDGETKPSIQGTGTEDYFLSAWGLRRCSGLYAGVPFLDPWGGIGSRVSAYRWHINDPIVFNSRIEVTIEHYGWMSKDENPKGEENSWNERQDDYSSVAFWYQTGTPTFTARAPHARERTLPNLERVTAAGRHFIDDKYHGPGKAVRQPLYEFYPKRQMFYVPDKAEDGWVEIPLAVQKKEPLRLVLSSTTAPDYGRYQPYLNGVKLGGPLDFYSGTTASTEYQLLDFWPEPGKYTFRLECVGKNVKSEGYALGLQSVNLRERRPRVLEYGRDKDKDWKKEPKVY